MNNGPWGKQIQAERIIYASQKHEELDMNHEIIANNELSCLYKPPNSNQAS